jgi:hypothetical protein
MTISVINTTQYIHNLEARMPFHYGIASMTAVPHLFLMAECEIDGQVQTGIAADSLIPKWFTKNPTTVYKDDITDMLAVIQAACQFAQKNGQVTSVFELWQATYVKQHAWASEQDYPPLLWGLGLSLVERALIDAFCRAEGLTFTEALRANALGIQLDVIHYDLAGKSPADLLPAQPIACPIVRHTVGLTDPLFEEDIKPGEAVDDGLPQSLQANMSTYGLTHFKIKLSGNTLHDIKRLNRIAQLFETSGMSNYAFTLDGNEQFTSVKTLKTFWESLSAAPSLLSFLDHMLYLEQPLRRDAALCPTTQEPLRQWVNRPIMIIDESDDQLDSLKIALDCGYSGTSHKNCKGIFKSIANACLLQHLKNLNPTGTYILSGEDLVNIGPVALSQDLVLMANLGIEHVERNGHHYFAGLSMFSEGFQEQVLSHHPDVYHRHSTGDITLNIQQGILDIGSFLSAPFGTGLSPELFTQFTPISEWDFEPLVSQKSGVK